MWNGTKFERGRMTRGDHGLLKVSSGPCSTLLRPAGRPPLTWPYGCFRGGPPAEWSACSRFQPFWTPHAVRLCEGRSSSSHSSLSLETFLVRLISHESQFQSNFLPFFPLFISKCESMKVFHGVRGPGGSWTSNLSKISLDLAKAHSLYAG
jgi:hypothetical protein